MTSRIAHARTHQRALFDYSHFSSIDGRHPWQQEVPGGHVLYNVRERKNGKIAWFNFDLAKEMGLIPDYHLHELNADIEHVLLDTFAIQIINEYDLINGTKIPASEIKPNHYMATRYLQLQHQSRVGLTSGDGRSIWNGTWTGKGRTWDITSCGTGATCLSPATHKHKRFFRTGDPQVSYGCGYSELDDGVMGAVFSEIMHRNGLPTERILCVIEFPGNLSINVRAGSNLLRPSHFFNHLKQGNFGRLKSAIDYYINREVTNGDWAPLEPGENRYKRLLSVVSRTFAEVAARFESEYIFCWLAWDGDNILTNGGIIDYGSVRQFGLFHHEYRFDDVERWSTTLTEQKDQARYIVQTFAQIEHYLNTGKKNSVQSFKNHDELKRFDRIFNATRRRLMLEKTGFTRSEAQSLLESHPDLVTQYEKAFRWFEQCTKQTKKPYRVADGVTRDALYSMRDILRELPKHLLKNKAMMTNRAFMDTIASSYCTQKDARPNLQRNLWISRFQTAWSNLVTASSQQSQIDRTHLVEQMAQRSTIINRYSRVTGDAICFVGDKILRGRKHLTGKETQELIANFIEDQVLVPERRTLPVENSIRVRGKSERLMRDMLKTVKSLRDGL